MSYEALVAESFRQKSALPFSNENASHARVIMKHILLGADKNVALFSDGLPADVDVDGKTIDVYDWSELVEAAESYLNKSNDSKLSIKIRLSREEATKASQKFIELESKFQGQVSIEWGKASKLPNFMANDQGALRIELKAHQAIACAFNPEAANSLLAAQITSN